MKTVWKWVLGIVIGLVVLAALVGLGFLVYNNFHAYRVAVWSGDGWSGRGPLAMPFRVHGWHMRGPGMMGYGMMPFGGLVGGLFSLGILALIVLGIVWLVRSLRKPTHVETPVAASAAVATHACPKCGRTVQDEWKNCPYCGKKL